MTIRETDKKYVAGTYNRFPVEIISGKGSVLTGSDGKQYIDMGSGIAVSSLGAADDGWIAAVTEQLSKIQHTSNLYYSEPCAGLAEQLCLRTGMKKVFFSNSGAEANECAIKAARKYSAEKKGGDCHTVITLKNSFHGRTLTTLAATGQDRFHELYAPLTPGFVHVTAGDADELRDTVEKTDPAAVMIECVQGEGGVVPISREYAGLIGEICRERDVPLVIDEVQTGNGRTGTLYSYTQFGLEPDVVSTAKGLAGGLPIGATMLGEKMKDIFSPGDNGSTFGGNPVSCAGALYVLSRIDDALLAEVREKSRYIFSELSGAPGVTSVTGLGLMIGIETEKPAGEIVSTCIENGVLCLTAKTKLRLLPALNIPFGLLEKAVGIIKKACAE
ncbi:MAG: aminotransferase class III-fold pyridoxal phosphate-dependent enzyme [Clostridia bacterium]|nr:aminotransferase class III-fold pyridoxal phosphate-dependent enzyme [Clostridia bacterium]